MVPNNVTKFHKILIKSVWVRERTSFGQTYVRKYVRTGVTLNAPAIVMAGALLILISIPVMEAHSGAFRCIPVIICTGKIPVLCVIDAYINFFFQFLAKR